MRAFEDDDTEPADHPDPDSTARRNAARTLEELLGSAEDHDRTAGASTDAEKWFLSESESLLHWAKERGRFLSALELGSLIDGFKVLEGGLEHQVFFRKRTGRVI